MTDLNDVKAGDYVLTALRWDEITSKPGEPLDFVRHRRGDKVKLNIEQARRLVVAGAVAKPGADGKAEIPGSKPATPPSAPEDLTSAPSVTTPAGAPPVDTAGYDPGADGETEAKVLEYVGTDPAAAAAVLEKEQAGKNRSGVVSKLQAIVDASQG